MLMIFIGPYSIVHGPRRTLLCILCMERKLTGDWAKADFEQTQGRVLRPCMRYGPS